MFQSGRFWPAFARAGLLKKARRMLVDGSIDEFDVGFVEPDVLLLQNAVHASDKEIEYQTSDAPDLQQGNQLEIDGENYRVIALPQKQSDTHFSKVKIKVIGRERYASKNLNSPGGLP